MQQRRFFRRGAVRGGLRARVGALVAVPVISAGMLVGVPPVTASAQTVITCTLAIANPHNSSHVPGTVNVVATWSCTAPVSELSISVQLFLDGVEVGPGGSNSNAGSAFLSANAANTCIPGEYFGTAQGTVVFPPGFEPPTGSGSVQSNTVPITCT